jgi:hypothetical protein
MNEPIITWLQTNWNLVVAIVAIVVTAASAIAALVPKPQPGTFWAKVLAVIDWLALNIGHAKENGKTPEAPSDTPE